MKLYRARQPGRGKLEIHNNFFKLFLLLRRSLVETKQLTQEYRWRCYQFSAKHFVLLLYGKQVPITCLLFRMKNVSMN